LCAYISESTIDCTYTIASQDQEFVHVGLDHCLGSVGVASDQILHVRIAKSSGHGENAIDTVVQDEASGASDTFALILITSLVIVGQPQGLAISAQNNARISNIGSVQHSLARGRLLKFGLGSWRRSTI
jgi:hypothetical protein